MSRIKLILILLAYIVLVLGLNFWHTKYFTVPGMGFTTEALKVKYIVDYSSLIRIGFFPLFLFFKIFSIYGLLLIVLLIYKAPEKFQKPSQKTLYLIVFVTLLFISTYNTLNYRYHLTLYPFLIYFAAIETDTIKSKWLKYSVLGLIGIATLISYKQIQPLKKMIFRAASRNDFLASDELQRQACKEIQKAQNKRKLNVVTYGASNLESFCTFDYLKFEGSFLDSEAPLNQKLNTILASQQEILLIGKTNKNAKYLKNFVPNHQTFYKNDVYSIFVPGDK